MKYHIDTIPVWDAYHEEGECSLCIMEKNIEESYVEFFLGGSVMESDTRIEVNKIGFCPHHFKLLYEAQNRLGLALITHTYFKELIQQFEKHAEKLQKDAGVTLGSSLWSRIVERMKGNKREDEHPVAEFQNWLVCQTSQCMICNNISNTLNRYAYTILYLWDTEPKFKKALDSSKGFCLHHLALTIKISRETLPQKKQAQWLMDIIPLQIHSLYELEQELAWFINKFDYRNEDKPWGSSKDSLPRTLQKLTGKFME
jgi:hypothetical protein